MKAVIPKCDMCGIQKPDIWYQVTEVTHPAGRTKQTLCESCKDKIDSVTLTMEGK